MAYADDLPILIEYVGMCVINPSGDAASIVLCSTDIQCFWRMTIAIQVFVIIEVLGPEVFGEPRGRRSGQWHATIRMSQGTTFIGGLHSLTQHMS